MITLAFDWGQKLMKTRMTTWMPTLWMDSANLGLTLPLRVPFKELFLLFGKWFGSRILRLLSWSPISLKMERYVVKKNLLEICLNIVEKQHSLLIYNNVIFLTHDWSLCIVVIFFFSQNVTFIGQILEQRLTETCLSACCVKISLLLTHYGLLVSDTWNLMYPQWVPFSFGKYWKIISFKKE